MSDLKTKTRFAPSPTGYVHIGNVRTALFNALLAKKEGGVFLLRIEDTDQERSRPEFQTALENDLGWLGLYWQQGPGVDDEQGPFQQSQRLELYQHYYDELIAKDMAYPCFCSAQELKLVRKAQLSAGQPPRYAGTCARLSKEEVQTKLDQGLQPSLRFRVPDNEVVEFADLVRGRQKYKTADIGDFIIRRSDGTPAFFFTNAVDDALMDVSHVLRGEDHLTNTPRQLLLLKALGLHAPEYGHISLIVGDDGAPLSKRHGAFSVRDLREQGYLPIALNNYLARLGHAYEGHDGFLPLEELARYFETPRLGRAPARFDQTQLMHWQKEAIMQASDDELWAWLGSDTQQLVPDEHYKAFVGLVRENAVLPADAVHLAAYLFTESIDYDDEARNVIGEAGRDFFIAASTALAMAQGDFKQWSNAIKEETGTKGKGLFMPLRAALTGELHGPEMARIMTMIPTETIHKRMQHAQELA